MRVHRMIPALLGATVLALATLVAAPGWAGPSPARAALPALAPDAVTTVPLAARSGGRGFGGRTRTVRPRETARQRSARRARNRGAISTVLRVLGIAWLFSVLFGVGSGGSPFGLLIVGAFVLWLVARSRSRRHRRSAFAA